VEVVVGRERRDGDAAVAPAGLEVDREAGAGVVHVRIAGDADAGLGGEFPARRRVGLRRREARRDEQHEDDHGAHRRRACTLRSDVVRQ
jgi:hypothetical protein